MTQTVREIYTDQDWDDLVDAADHATVYHRSGWLAALDATTGAPMRRLVLDSENGPLALWPIAILRKGPIRVAGSPLPGWNTAYLGPLFLPACSDKAGAVATMMRASPVRRPAFVATRTMDTGVDLSPLGFRKTREFETFEMDLTMPEQALWDNLKSTCRTRIRKGEKNGLEVREENDEAYIDSFWQMATDVFAKSNQRPPYSLAFLRQIESQLRRRGELLVTSAFLESERVATLIIPHDRTTAMYFAGGSLASRLDLAPNNLLHWKTMLLCRKRGLKRYDFISNRGSPGKFKSTFLPIERVSCHHWEFSKNQVIDRLKQIYERQLKSRRRIQSGGQAHE